MPEEDKGMAAGVEVGREVPEGDTALGDTGSFAVEGERRLLGANRETVVEAAAVDTGNLPVDSKFLEGSETSLI